MPWTNVQLLANVRDRTSGQYNNALYNAVNQNLVQGQIHSVSVNEVNFPYDIPNIQAGFNTFDIEFASQPPTVNALECIVPPGFYTPTELEAALAVAITAANNALPVPFAGNLLPVFTYDDTNNTFTVTAGAGAGSLCSIFSAYTFWNTGGVITRNLLGKDIMSIMGWAQSQGAGYAAANPNYNPLVVGTGNPKQSGSAPMLFTQYIDICSPELCQYQYFRDGSTTNLARRSDVICRLYISNNVATQEEEGTRPFVINRQFNNARVMRWSSGSSVGSMSIQLYDDVGQPLKTTWQPRPYQITFNVYEQDKDGTTY